MANQTLLKFGYPGSLIHEYEHWVVMLRPAQVTAGSLIVAAKASVLAFGELPQEAFTELKMVTAHVEATMRSEIAYEKINYVMLMMVDPHVHFHVFPRYAGSRSIEGVTLADKAWPGPPDLASTRPLSQLQLSEIRSRLSKSWLTII